MKRNFLIKPLTAIVVLSLALPSTACHRKHEKKEQPFIPQTADQYDQDYEVANSHGGSIPWWYWWGFHPGYTWSGNHYTSDTYRSRPGSPIYVPSSGNSRGSSSASSSSISGKSSASGASESGGFGASAAGHSGGGSAGE